MAISDFLLEGVLTFKAYFDKKKVRLKSEFLKKVSFMHWLFFGYLTKLKRGMGLVFTADFHRTFSLRLSSLNTLSNDQAKLQYLGRVA